jgi:hypothetical protein
MHKSVRRACRLFFALLWAHTRRPEDHVVGLSRALAGSVARDKVRHDVVHLCSREAARALLEPSGGDALRASHSLHIICWLFLFQFILRADGFPTASDPIALRIWAKKRKEKKRKEKKHKHF